MSDPECPACKNLCDTFNFDKSSLDPRRVHGLHDPRARPRCRDRVGGQTFKTCRTLVANEPSKRVRGRTLEPPVLSGSLAQMTGRSQTCTKHRSRSVDSEDYSGSGTRRVVFAGAPRVGAASTNASSDTEGAPTPDEARRVGAASTNESSDMSAKDEVPTTVRPSTPVARVVECATCPDDADSCVCSQRVLVLSIARRLCCNDEVAEIEEALQARRPGGELFYVSRRRHQRRKTVDASPRIFRGRVAAPRGRVAGRDMDIPWGRVAATPRAPRGESRGDDERRPCRSSTASRWTASSSGAISRCAQIATPA